MREMNTLVDQYVTVWNEPDADLRRKSITERKSSCHKR